MASLDYRAMRDATCVVDGCKLRNDMTRECANAKAGHGFCDYGAFANVLLREVGDVGEWKMRQYKDGPIKATLCGKAGVVEVWGGPHAPEVWLIERGTKAETMLCERWAAVDGSLRDAVMRGCAMAGVQTRLVM